MQKTAFFKGGTSLSKCYPGSINRFSEDIDLTFITTDALNNKQYSKALKHIEMVLATGFNMQKIDAERNDRNKSSFIWADGEDIEKCRIKLEIGSSVRPDPYAKRPLKTYIQEYLEAKGMTDAVSEFELKEVAVNTLDITRTFLDKLMSVKRHAICGTLPKKVRHIYDVTVLYDRADIKAFLADKAKLKPLLELTKKTDSFYLEKRNISAEYNPMGPYDFSSWESYFDSEIKKRYEDLHNDLLYSSEPQDFKKAIKTFKEISDLLASYGE